jgi:L-seryl-tRNA(Ser) seleniumtransferase
MHRSVYEQLGVTTYINAADSYTFIGGSRMPPEVIEAMRQAAEHFVDLDELHDRIGEELARLTRKEAAMVTSGAAAGLAIAVAACVAGDDPGRRRLFPHLDGMKSEVIVHRSQRNGFDAAVVRLGVSFVEIGSERGTDERELEAAIRPQTACILYFDSTDFSGSLPLETVIRVAARHGTKVVVDAAAQLPPVENLWRYTSLGADLALFSGGKTLCGPQGSGLIVGKKQWVKACRCHAGPAADAVGRPMKVSREEMVGLYAALKRYISLDHQAVRERHDRMVEKICRELTALGYRAYRRYPGPTGQDYPLAMIDMRGADRRAAEIHQRMKTGNPAILVGLARDGSDRWFINPLHLRDDELDRVLSKIKSFGPAAYRNV